MNARRRLTAIAAIALVAGGIGLQRWLASPPPAPAEVTTDTGAGKPGIVELGSDSCANCRAMAKVVAELRERHGESLRVDSHDIRRNPQALSIWEIKAIPTVIFVDAEGRELARHVGYLSADEIDGIFKRLSIEGRSG